jgi:hypothetical protein
LMFHGQKHPGYIFLLLVTSVKTPPKKIT